MFYLQVHILNFKSLNAMLGGDIIINNFPPTVRVSL